MIRISKININNSLKNNNIHINLQLILAFKLIVKPVMKSHNRDTNDT